MKEELPGQGEGLRRQQQQTPIIPTPHTMFFQPSHSRVQAAAPNPEYAAAMQAQLAKTPGARNLPEHLAAAAAQARQAEATAVQAAEAQLRAANAEAAAYEEAVRNRHLQEEKQQAAAYEEAVRNRHLQEEKQQAAAYAEAVRNRNLQEEKQQAAAGNTNAWEEKLAEESRSKVELERQSALLLQKIAGYSEREIAVDARMVEREGKLQETAEFHEQVQLEKNRLQAVLMLRENADDRRLLEEFSAYDAKLTDKHAELMGLQHEDMEKKKKLAEKKNLVQEHVAFVADQQEINKAALQALGDTALPQADDPRQAASKRLLNQLHSLDRQDAEVAAMRIEQLRQKKVKKSSQTEAEASQQRRHEMELAEQQRQQHLQDLKIQEELQAQAQANAVAEQQQKEKILAEEQAAMALAEQEAQQQEQVRQEEQRQKQVQEHLRARMVAEEQRQQVLMSEHQQEEELLKEEMVAEQKKALLDLEQQQQQRLQLLQQRAKAQQEELYQESQERQVSLQQKLQAANNLQTLPDLETSDDEAATPVAKKPKPYTTLRGVRQGYMAPSSKAPAQIPVPSGLPQAKMPGPSIPAAFASQQVAFTPGRLPGGSGLFLTSPAKPGFRPSVVPPRPKSLQHEDLSQQSPAAAPGQQHPAQQHAQPEVAAPESETHLGRSYDFLNPFFSATNLIPKKCEIVFWC